MWSRLKFKSHSGEDDDLEGLPPLERIARQIPRLRSEVRLARRSYRFTVAVVAVAIVTGAALFWGQHQDDVAREAADRQYELDQCERGNTTRERIADVVDAQTDALITASAPADGVVTPRRAEAVATYRAGVDPIVAELREPRDCEALLTRADK